MLDGIVETLRREIPLPAPDFALQDGIVAVNRANRERRAAAQCIENLAITDDEREAIKAAIRGYENEDGVYLPSDLNEPCLRIAATLRGLLERTK